MVSRLVILQYGRNYNKASESFIEDSRYASSSGRAEAAEIMSHNGDVRGDESLAPAILSCGQAVTGLPSLSMTSMRCLTGSWRSQAEPRSSERRSM